MQDRFRIVTWLLRGGVTTFDGRAADHVMKFPRPSPSVFAYRKRSKTGGIEGLGTRLSKLALQLIVLAKFNMLQF